MTLSTKTIYTACTDCDCCGEIRMVNPETSICQECMEPAPIPTQAEVDASINQALTGGTKLNNPLYAALMQLNTNS